MKKGFTLVEILIAVMITTILVAMAVPMYEKAIEKSRLAEARTMLKRLYEAKRRVMDDQEITTYVGTAFGFENLDFAMPCTSTTTSHNHVATCNSRDFTYDLSPTGTGQANAVCAARRRGDHVGVAFLYQESDATGQGVFQCSNGGAGNGACDEYGMSSSTSSAWCSPLDDSGAAVVNANPGPSVD